MVNLPNSQDLTRQDESPSLPLCLSLFLSRIVPRDALFDHRFHARQIDIDLALWVGTEERSDQMPQPSGNWIASKADIVRVVPSGLLPNRTRPACAMGEPEVVFQPIKRLGTYLVTTAVHATGTPAGPPTIQRDASVPIRWTSHIGHETRKIFVVTPKMRKHPSLRY
jgi:hypothetical protein